MRVDFFYDGKAYGSVDSEEMPRIGALYCDKMIIKITDMRRTWDRTDQEVIHADFWCELGDP